MAPRGMKNQQIWLQDEVTPGTAAVNAMKRYGGFKGRPSYTTTQEKFQAAGSRLTSAIIKNTELGGFTVESIQDYNFITAVLDSVFGKATPTTPVGATNARQRVYNVVPDASTLITPQTKTMIWGDSQEALQLRHFLFTAFGLTINRGQLGFTTSAISYTPEKDATLPSVGTSFVPAAPIPARTYGFWMDNTWAAQGTTRMLAAYEGGITVPELWVPDWPVNELLPSFGQVVEAETTEFTSRLVLGMDATAAAHIGDWEDGVMKFIRFKSTGAEIEAGHNYSLQIDQAVKIINPGEFGTAPQSPTLVLPFEYEVMEDPVSGNAMTITVINAVAA